MALTCAVKGSSNSSGKLKKWKTECMIAYILQKAVTMSIHRLSNYSNILLYTLENIFVIFTGQWIFLVDSI